MSHLTLADTPGNTRRAALAFLLASVFFAYAFALRVSPSVMVDELMRDYAVGAAILGNLSAFYFYAYAGLQIPVGLLLDRVGPRLLMSVACAAVGVGCLLFANSEVIAWGYAGRLIIGAGCAFSWVGTLAIVNQWFPTRFALLAGVSQMIAMGGAVIGQAPLALLVNSIGWRSTTTVLAAVGLALALMLFLIVRDRGSVKQKRVSGGPGHRSVLRNPQTWLIAGFSLSMTGPLLAFGGLWGVPYLATAYGLERAEAAGIASMVFVGNGLGAVLLGWWSDRIRRRRLPMACGALLTITSQLILICVPGLSSVCLVALAVMIGIGGSSLVVAFACGREHNLARNVGLTIGVINTATVGSGALFQPIIGWILDLQWTGTVLNGVPIYEAHMYRWALGVLPLTSLLGLALVALIRGTHARRMSNQ